MANSVYWTGANGNTYVKTAGATGGVQDYGKLAPGSSIYGSTLINDPNPGGGGNGGKSGGVYGGSAPDPYAAQAARQAAAEANERADLVAQYQNQINALQGQFGQLDNQQNIGLGNLQKSYRTADNRLNSEWGVAQRDYTTSKQDTEAGYQSARNAAATQARNKLSALQRLLGISGAGNSSAAQQAVPLAVAQDATQKIAPVQGTYASNRRNQDVNLQDTERNYKNNQQDLVQKLFAQEQGLKQQIAQTRQGLLAQIQQANIQKAVAGGANYRTAAAAQGGITNQINSLLAQITQLGNQYPADVISTGQVQYKAPELGEYLMGQTAGISQSGLPGSDSVNPLFVPLLGREEDQNIVGA